MAETKAGRGHEGLKWCEMLNTARNLVNLYTLATPANFDNRMTDRDEIKALSEA